MLHAPLTQNAAGSQQSEVTLHVKQRKEGPLPIMISCSFLLRVLIPGNFDKSYIITVDLNKIQTSAKFAYLLQIIAVSIFNTFPVMAATLSLNVMLF
ncbi:hypothetical protein ACWGOQ_0008475 [Aquimarina sp. M1]